MGGLLYKDFMALKGKKTLLLLAAFTLVFMVFKMFPVTALSELSIMDEEGNKGSVVELFTVTAEGVLLLTTFGFCNMSLQRLLSCDETTRMKNYLASLPLDKRTYITSKFVFSAIMIYGGLSLYWFWHVVDAVNLSLPQTVLMSSLFQAFSVPAFSFLLVLNGVELTLFILLGRGRGMLCKTGFIMALFMLAIGYMLFGDMTIFDRIDVGRIMAFLSRHAFESYLCSILGPVFSVIIYYGLYRLTVSVYEKKEVEYD